MGKRYNVKYTASLLDKAQVTVIDEARHLGIQKLGGRWEFTDEDIHNIRLSLAAKRDKIQVIASILIMSRGDVIRIAKKFKLKPSLDYDKLLAVCSLWKNWENMSLLISK